MKINTNFSLYSPKNFLVRLIKNVGLDKNELVSISFNLRSIIQRDIRAFFEEKVGAHPVFRLLDSLIFALFENL